MSPITGYVSHSLAMVAAWTPASLGSALVGWWIADTGVGTSGGNVTSVADQSGNGFNLTNNGTVPFSATGFNGKPTFNFLAANNALLQTSAGAFALGATNAGSFFGVGQMLTATTNFGGAWVYGTGGVDDFDQVGCAACVTRNGTANSIVSDRNSINTNSAAMSLATNHRFGYIVDSSGNGITYVDNVAGGAAVNQVTAGTNWVSPGTFIIGGRYTTGAPAPSGNPWEGPISEVVVTNTALSSSDRNNLDTYFKNKWGI